jgi:hypothetical protein
MPFLISCTAFRATASPRHSRTLAEKDCLRQVNVIWALLNLVVGYVLFRVGKVSTGNNSALVIFFAGIVVISTMLSVRFAKKQAK